MPGAKLKNFGTYAEAGLAQNLLEKFGIRAWIQKGNLNAAGEFAGFSGDADLFVFEKDFKKAKDILGNAGEVE